MLSLFGNINLLKHFCRNKKPGQSPGPAEAVVDVEATISACYVLMPGVSTTFANGGDSAMELQMVLRCMRVSFCAVEVQPPLYLITRRNSVKDGWGLLPRLQNLIYLADLLPDAIDEVVLLGFLDRHLGRLSEVLARLGFPTQVLCPI
jgi:hypothetical protein